ncbi:hypothetical protein [Ferrimonas balearica]|uniref:hypothetical protein n=1 Tax=Ferrimonas balearica TaxID=44012 RepID=UPI0011D1683E|nr:hypothetical protein [Ferrimonas balearica]
MDQSKSRKVSVRYSFLFQSIYSARGGFMQVYQSMSPSECSIKENDNGSIVLNVTVAIEKNEHLIAEKQHELEDDFRHYGGIFLSRKFHYRSCGNKIVRKRLKLATILTNWATHPIGLRGYKTRKMPLYTIFFAVLLVFILSFYI